MFGFRPDGRRLNKKDPFVAITPYFMPMRCDAQVFLNHLVDYEKQTRYIAQKSREGEKITFMEILIASFVRSVAEYPEINCFIMNKQLFARKELTASFAMLRDTSDGSIEETTIKLFFDPSDTIFDVAARVRAGIEANRKEESANLALKLARIFMKVPFLPFLVINGVRILDRYGLCPKYLIDVLPFHTSLFVTNMASIGMTNVYHHIYNFGNTSLFFSIGAPERSYTVDSSGKPVRKYMLPIGITADERVCSGAMYAKFFSAMKRYLNNPELLETAPESVRYNPRAEYHMPKLESANEGAAISA